MIKLNKLLLTAFVIFYICIYGIFIIGLISNDRLTYFIQNMSTTERDYVSSLSKNIIQIYRAVGSKNTIKYLKFVYANKKIKSYLILPNKQIIASSKITSKIRKIGHSKVKKNLFSSILNNNNLLIYHISENSHSNYIVVLDISEFKILDKHFILSMPMFVRLAISIFIAGLIFYIASSILYRPLKIIANAMINIRQGKLNTRIAPFFGNRKDELAILGKNFDAMASSLESNILAKEEMFQHITHELRSPIARSQIAVSLLEKEVDSSSMEDVKIIKNEMHLVDNLIDEILSLAKFNMAENFLKISSFNLTSCIKEVIQNANYEKEQEVVFLKKDIDIHVTLDKNLIQSAIENIVRNALVHSPKGTHVFVDIKLNLPELFISISDNGPGIADNKIKTIFEPFISGPNNKGNHYKSYGLGLAIAKKIIDMHLGTIQAKNILPHGLEVTMLLPANG